jgi:hypothetical protein
MILQSGVREKCNESSFYQPFEKQFQDTYQTRDWKMILKSIHQTWFKIIENTLSKPCSSSPTTISFIHDEHIWSKFDFSKKSV